MPAGGQLGNDHAAPPAGTGATAPASRRWILYVDLDAFYVSCEQRERPELKDRAVIVGPDPRLARTRGVVLSASYEARASGVRSAMPVGRALERCPEAIWVPPDFGKYARISAQVHERLARRFREVVMLSIDEAAAVLEAQGPTEAEAAGRAVQSDLRDSLGLPSSVGIAPWRVLAKIATDRAKPGGVIVVGAQEAARFLAPLAVDSIPGIGPKTAARLVEHGIRTIGDLGRAEPVTLRRIVGAWAPELVRIAHGRFPTDGPLRAGSPRSRSLDRTFASDLTELAEILAAIDELAGELIAGLREEELTFRSVAVAVRWADFRSSQRQHLLPSATERLAPLRESAERLLRQLWERERAGAGRAVRRLSLRASRLSARRRRPRSLEEFDAGPPAVK